MKEFGVVVHICVHHLVTDRTMVICFWKCECCVGARRSIDWSMLVLVRMLLCKWWSIDRSMEDVFVGRWDCGLWLWLWLLVVVGTSLDSKNTTIYVSQVGLSPPACMATSSPSPPRDKNTKWGGRQNALSVHFYHWNGVLCTVSNDGWHWYFKACPLTETTWLRQRTTIHIL